MSIASELRFGEGLWKGAVTRLSESPPWAGRHLFQVVSFGPAVRGGEYREPLVLVLGGCCGNNFKNDVWGSRDGGLTWQEVSPQEDGRFGDNGFVHRTKWCGRQGFAAASGWDGCLRGLIYVVGGLGPKLPLSDVWVSDDLGKTFVRMCAEAPFGRRVSSGLAVCPGKPHRLVLIGGGWNDDVDHWDCWMSDDMGVHWSEIVVPDNAVQRRLPALTFTQPGTLVLIGGHNRRTPYEDAYVARIKWVSKCAVWQRLDVRINGESADELSASELPWFMSHFTAFDPLQGRFLGLASLGRLAIGRLPVQVFNRKAKEPPGGDPPCDSVQVNFQHIDGRSGPLASMCDMGSWTAGKLHLLIAADAVRLFVFTESAIWRSGGTSAAHVGVQGQLQLLDRLGRQLQESHCLIEEIWDKILSALFGPKLLDLAVAKSGGR